MKKLLALVLVLTLVLSMSAMAFATTPEPEEYEDANPVKINKIITLENEGTINPAEKFNFTVGNGTVLQGNASSAPAFDPDEFEIDIAQGILSGSKDIVLPNFTQVGVYTYPISETPGNTAGFSYDVGPYNLVITVINNPDYVQGQTPKFLRVLTLTDGNNVKRDAFDNDFKAGDLVISKAITGNYAVFDDEFEVTVVLSPPEGKVIKEGPIAIAGAVDDLGSIVKNSDGTVTVKFKVTHESEVTISDIPYGVGYVLTEDAGAYTSNIPAGGFTGTIGKAKHELDINNDLDTEIPTGINLDNLPYILILVGAGLGLVAFTMKKRVRNEN